MNLVAIHEAFITRLAADSTLITTYLGSSANIFFGQVPKSADVSGNSIVINLFTNGHQDTGSKDIVSAEAEFVVNVVKDDAINPEGPDAVLHILDRLYGDAVDNAGNVPAYGLHRLEDLPLSSPASNNYKVFGFTHSTLEPLDSTDPDLYVAYSTSFDFFIQTL